MPTFKAATLNSFAELMLVAAGASEAASAVVAKHLVNADACGYPSHGLNLLPTYLTDLKEGRLRKDSCPHVTNLGLGALSVDGQNGFGQVAVEAAIPALINETTKTPLALARFKNIGHVGRLAPFVEDIATHERIGLMVAGFALNSREAAVAPKAGASRLFGTNPLAFAFPGGPPVDLSTSQSTVFEVLRARRERATLQPGVAVDAVGRPTTDPDLMLDGGALLPIAEHKGLSLSMLTVLLGSLCGENQGGVGGVVLIAINPKPFITIREIEEVTSRIETALSGGREASRLPGRRAQQARLMAKCNGVNLSSELVHLLIKQANELGVSAEYLAP